MHENNDTNGMREYNTSDVTESILYTILLNNLVTISTSMANTIYNDSVSTTAYVELSQDNENNQRLWNLSKTTITSLSESTAIPFNTSRSTTIYTPTTESFDEFGPPEGVEYIFVPLGVVVSVIILSAVVLIISRKRKLERLRHRLMPMYNFDPGEEEEDDWETELLDECYSTHQRRVCKIVFTCDLCKCFENKNQLIDYSKDINPWIPKRMQSYSVVNSTFSHGICIIFSLSYDYHRLNTNSCTHEVLKHTGMYDQLRTIFFLIQVLIRDQRVL